MSKIYSFKENMMIKADYSDPKLHKHLAFHIIISLGKNMRWIINEEEVLCRGICINSEVLHTGYMTKEGALVFLFMMTSGYVQSLNEKYLKGKSFAVIDDKIVDNICKKYNEMNGNISSSDELLKLLNLDISSKSDMYDERVCYILSYIKNKDTIEHKIVDDLSNKVFLSKSRMSHIFKEQTGMTLHSYLAFIKLKKSYEYIKNKKMNITDASLKAGFDSPSHCASTCKRMFGISLREVFKTIT